eukprot:Nk52_evm7s252 gene=Nk52_evmTU7s252
MILSYSSRGTICRLLVVLAVIVVGVKGGFNGDSGMSHGVLCKYYANAKWLGTPVMRIDANITFEVGLNSFDLFGSTYSSTSSRSLYCHTFLQVPHTGYYRLHVTSYGAVSVYANSSLQVDKSWSGTSVIEGEDILLREGHSTMLTILYSSKSTISGLVLSLRNMTNDEVKTIPSDYYMLSKGGGVNIADSRGRDLNEFEITKPEINSYVKEYSFELSLADFYESNVTNVSIAFDPPQILSAVPSSVSILGGSPLSPQKFLVKPDEHLFPSGKVRILDVRLIVTVEDSYDEQMIGISKSIPIYVRLGGGWYQEVFDNIFLSGAVTEASFPEKLELYMEDYEPINDIAGSTFYSVRWTGVVSPPYNGTYVITVVADDGIRVRVNGNVKVDSWQEHELRMLNFQIDMETAEEYIFEVEYFQINFDAHVSVMWSMDPLIEKQFIPSSNIKTLQLPPRPLLRSPSNKPLVISDSDSSETLIETALSFSSNGNVVVSLSPKNSSLISLSGTTKLYFGESRAWYLPIKTIILPVAYQAGLEETTVIARVTESDSLYYPVGLETELSIPITLSGGMKAEYFNSLNLQGGVAFTKREVNMTFVYENTPPGPGIDPNAWSARWSGHFHPKTSGAHVFHLVSDDGSRLYVNHSLLIDLWEETGKSSFHSAPMLLNAGESYPIELQYNQDHYHSELSLRVSVDDGPPEVLDYKYLSTNASASSVAHFGFEHCAGTTFTESISGAQGSIYGFDYMFTNGVVGNAFYMGQQNNSVAEMPEGFFKTPTNVLSIAFWLKADFNFDYGQAKDFDAVSKFENFQFKFMGDAWNMKPVCLLWLNGTMFSSNMNSDGTASFVQGKSSSDFTIEDNNWHHYSCVYDGNSILLYIDGSMIQKATGMHGPVGISEHSTNFKALHIGSSKAEGIIDEVYIAAKVFTSKQIESLSAFSFVYSNFSCDHQFDFLPVSQAKDYAKPQPCNYQFLNIPESFAFCSVALPGDKYFYGCSAKVCLNYYIGVGLSSNVTQMSTDVLYLLAIDTRTIPPFKERLYGYCQNDIGVCYSDDRGVSWTKDESCLYQHAADEKVVVFSSVVLPNTTTSYEWQMYNSSLVTVSSSCVVHKNLHYSVKYNSWLN